MVDVGADMRELAEESLVLDAEEGTLEQLEWTSDGQVLTVNIINPNSMNSP